LRPVGHQSRFEHHDEKKVYYCYLYQGHSFIVCYHVINCRKLKKKMTN
jgi:hypothetical protein